MKHPFDRKRQTQSLFGGRLSCNKIIFLCFLSISSQAFAAESRIKIKLGDEWSWLRTGHSAETLSCMKVPMAGKESKDEHIELQSHKLLGLVNRLDFSGRRH